MPPAKSGDGTVSVSSQPISMYAMFSVLLVVRLASAVLAPIMDCDETFNYVEPIHYVTYGTGMQTWEYSPEFALRSYVYVELHALPVRFAKLLGFNKVQAFYCLRGSLGLTSALCEACFCDALQRSCSTRVAVLTLCFLAGASGMFHASVAMLPSTTCMYAVLLGFAAWLRGRHALGLACGSFAVLLGMAVAAPMFVPMGLAALAPQNLGFLRVLSIAMLALVMFALVPSLIDWCYYGTRLPVWAMGNHLLYNFGIGGGGGGADLYGTEPWTFYPKNLLLNFNMVALLAMPALLCSHRKLLLVLMQMSMWVTLALFTKMAHKEERFLTMVYPLLCLSAAITVDTLLGAVEMIVGWCLGDKGEASRPPRPQSVKKVVSASLAAAFVVAFAGISCARSAALHFYFRAPLQLYEKLYYDGVEAKGSASGLCVGKEWYRFPSSFFLPSSKAGTLPLLWVNSSFGGQLPRPFAPWPQGLWQVPPNMNDRNLREPSRYHHENECSVLVDLVLEDQAEEPPDAAVWQETHCEPFLDAERSPLPWRAFYVPFGMSSQRIRFGRYCIWHRSLEGAGSQLKARIAPCVSRSCFSPRRRQASSCFVQRAGTTSIPTVFDDGSRRPRKGRYSRLAHYVVSHGSAPSMCHQVVA